jgi:hypothetical protein
MTENRKSSWFVRAAIVSSMLMIGCGGGAASSNEGAAESSTGGESETMSLDTFAAAIAREASPELCGTDGAPLRACFEVTAEQCDQIFMQAMTACANELRQDLPATIDESNADAAATTISECAGAAYRMGLEQNGLVRITPECQAS